MPAAAFDSSRPTGADRESVALTVAGASLVRDVDGDVVLEAVDLELRRGECVLLRGATGSGKTTLLRALAGMPGVGLGAGRIERRGPGTMLGQHIDTQLLCPTVGEEIALGLRGRMLSEGALRERSDRVLRDVGLEGFSRRETDRLSAGQRQRVLLAALLALEPGTLLLDEPTSSLDAPSRRRLAETLGRLKRQGVAILVAEHSVEDLWPVVDRVVRIEDGHLIEGEGHSSLRAESRVPRAESVDGLARLDALPTGVRLLLSGPNGIGKSTKLRSLARIGSSRGSVSLVIQEPRRALFARTARDEVAFGFDRLVTGPADREREIDRLLASFGLADLALRSPRRMSFGEQHRLAIAASLASQPAYLLLDEPFAGQDALSRERLLATLGRVQRETGVGIVIASHDPSPLDGWCHRRVELGRQGENASGAAGVTPGPDARRPALQRCRGDSWLHAMAPGWKAALALLFGAFVLFVDALALLVVLLAGVASVHLSAGLGTSVLWRDMRWLLLQGGILVGLTVALRGSEAWGEGMRAALQITLVFLPAMLFVRTTRMDAVLDGMSGWLPERIGFAVGVTLRFLPFFARELGEVVEMQRLRGARLRPGDLWRLGAWRDVLECVAVPMTLRAIEVANEAADAARVRGIGGAEVDPPVRPDEET